MLAMNAPKATLMLSAALYALSCLSSVLADEVIVTSVNGKDIRVRDAAIYAVFIAPHSKIKHLEGIAVPAQIDSKYTVGMPVNMIMGLQEYRVIPWSKIELARI